jgi:hypothetical protein
MSDTWSGKAPTGLHIEWDGEAFAADAATYLTIKNAIEKKEVVDLTVTGPFLVVTIDDHATVAECAVNLWQQLLTPAQFDQMTWTNPPFMLPDSDKPSPEGIVY